MDQSSNYCHWNNLNHRYSISRNWNLYWNIYFFWKERNYNLLRNTHRNSRIFNWDWNRDHNPHLDYQTHKDSCYIRSCYFKPCNWDRRVTLHNYSCYWWPLSRWEQAYNCYCYSFKPSHLYRDWDSDRNPRRTLSNRDYHHNWSIHPNNI